MTLKTRGMSISHSVVSVSGLTLVQEHPVRVKHDA